MRIALITGGGNGLGLAIGRSLVHNEIFVCIFEKRKMCSFQLLGEMEKEKFWFFEVDVTNIEQVNRAVQQIITKFGQLDILINNAGLKVFKSMTEISNQTWKDVIDVNLNGPFIVTKSVLSHMIEKKHGVIINIASKAGFRGYSTSSVYSSSKAGLMRLTESMAADMETAGIFICAICPSTIATPDVLAENPDLRKSELLEPEYIGRIILRIINSPRKFKGRCIMLSKPRTFLRIFTFLFMDSCYSLIDYYRFRR